MKQTEQYVFDAVDEICKFIPDCEDWEREEVKKQVESAIEKATKDMIDVDFVKAKLLEFRTAKPPHHVELKSEDVEKLWRSGEAVMQSHAAHASEREQQAALSIAVICLGVGCKGTDGGIVSAVRELAEKYQSLRAAHTSEQQKAVNGPVWTSMMKEQEAHAAPLVNYLKRFIEDRQKHIGITFDAGNDILNWLETNATLILAELERVRGEPNPLEGETSGFPSDNMDY